MRLFPMKYLSPVAQIGIVLMVFFVWSAAAIAGVVPSETTVPAGGSNPHRYRTLSCPSGTFLTQVFELERASGDWWGHIMAQGSECRQMVGVSMWDSKIFVPSETTVPAGGSNPHRYRTLSCPSGTFLTQVFEIERASGDWWGHIMAQGSECRKPAVGTIIGKAKINNVEQPVSFGESYTPPGGAPTTASMNLPATFPNMPAGTWKINSVTPPAGLVLNGITGCGNSLPCSATLVPGGTLEVTYNFATAASPSGTIIVRTTKDGANWDSPSFTANYTGPGGTTDATINTDTNGQQMFPGSMIGTYTFNSVCSGCLPAGITFSGATPSSQALVGGGTSTFTLNFTTPVVPPPPVPTFVISPTSASVQVGGNQYFTAIYDPDGSGPLYPQYVTNSSGWSSSNNSVAEVSSTGVANGKSAGFATITASYSGLTASASLTVTAPTPTFTVEESSWSLALNDNHHFRAYYYPDGISKPETRREVTTDSATVWSSPDTAKVTVSGGLATRVGHGLGSVSASYSGLSDSSDVLDPARLRVIPSSKSLQIGEIVQLAACLNTTGGNDSADCSNASEQRVTTLASWSSNRPYVASVDNTSERGLTRAIAAGPTTRITASYNGLLERSSITVTAPPPPPDPELVVSCSASSASTITGQPVVWTAVASGGTGSYSYLWLGSSPLNGETSNPVTVTYTTTTPNPKTGRVRVTSGGQPVTQDCTTSVTVNTPSPPPTATLSASPEIIDKGNSSTLEWSSTNADSCTAMGGFDTGGVTDGSKDVSPVETSDYQVRCEGPGGSANSNIVSVTVISVKASISANPSCINGGGNAKISWSATPAAQVASCNVSGPGLSSSQVSGSQTVNVTSKSTYDIACRTNGGATVTKQVIVDTAGCWSEF